MSYKRYELVELVIPVSTASRFPYPDIPQLRDDTTQDIIVRGLEAFSILDVPNSPLGNPLATVANLQAAFLTLYIQDEESVHQVPLIRLLNTFHSLGTSLAIQQFDRFALENVKVDWNKSYIEVPGGFGNNAIFSILLGVNYKKLPPGTWKKITENQVQGM